MHFCLVCSFYKGNPTVNSLIPDLSGSEALLLTVHETPQICWNRVSVSRWENIWGVRNTFLRVRIKWLGAGMELVRRTPGIWRPLRCKGTVAEGRGCVPVGISPGGGFQDVGFSVSKPGKSQANWVTLVTLVLPCSQSCLLPTVNAGLSLSTAHYS